MTSMNNPKLNFGKLPEYVQRKAGRDILGYSTPLIGLKTNDLSEQPVLLGSATFVQFGEDKGLLTAQHVIEKSDYSKCLSIGLIIKSYIHRFTIKKKYLQEHSTKPESSEFGPDLAFIKIPEQDAITIASQNAFWQMDANRYKISKILTYRNKGFWTIFGCPSVYERIESGKSGFANTFVPGGLLGMSAKPKFLSRKTYDYFDLPVAYENDNDLPKSFKGVSGGGLWYVPLFKSASDPKKIQVGQPSLMGVAFYETAINDCVTAIRCHGPKSIYNKMKNILDNEK